MPPRYEKKEAGPDPGLTKLKQDLAQDAPGRCYLFHGEEAYLRAQYLTELKKKLLPPGMEAFNLHELSGKDFSLRALAEALDCLPMMARRTMVVVTDYDLFKAGEADREALTKLLEDLPEYVCLVFHYDLMPYKPDARTKLGQRIKELVTVVKFARQDQRKLINWIARRFQALGHEIDSQLAEYLIFLCGDLMTELIPEITKIGSYATHTAVTREDIDAVAIPKLDAVVFQLTDAITGRDYDRACKVLSDLLHMGEAPQMLLAVLGRQLRQLYSARLALEEGKGSGYVAELWSMRSSYPAQKLMEGARRYSLDWCRRGVSLCADADLRMKSTYGVVDGETLLVDLVLALANPPAKG